MTKLTGLAYLLEHASFADKEAREKTEARIKPVIDGINFGDDQTITALFDALRGDQSARVSLGMEKGE